MELAFGHRPVAEEAGRHPLASLHFVGEREPDRERQASRDDPVAAVQPALRVEQVHRAAATA